MEGERQTRQILIERLEEWRDLFVPGGRISSLVFEEKDSIYICTAWVEAMEVISSIPKTYVSSRHPTAKEAFDAQV